VLRRPAVPWGQEMQVQPCFPWLVRGVEALDGRQGDVSHDAHSAPVVGVGVGVGLGVGLSGGGAGGSNGGAWSGICGAFVEATIGCCQVWPLSGDVKPSLYIYLIVLLRLPGCNPMQAAVFNSV
jgi:hypothetical protein